ncbi:MAG: GAF domain-containing protein [Spirochaetales bacterium]|nr:GAF domain-containing protein [Spirochaetales bacterium]
MNKKTSELTIPDNVLEQWQDIIDIMSRLLDVPAGLIMRIVHEDIEVYLSSDSEGNPYKVGDKEHFENSGLYCETAIKTRDMLHVPNALKDEDWKDNPDVKLNMISYLGVPLLQPDGSAFGTLCVLDNRENHYSAEYIQLMNRFKKVIERDLEMIWAVQELGDENKKLQDYVKELKVLRGMIPICAKCKKIRNKDGFWDEVEEYIAEHSDVTFTHSLCKECAEELYGKELWFQNNKIE